MLDDKLKLHNSPFFQNISQLVTYQKNIKKLKIIYWKHIQNIV